jgi:hypothetical protein
MASLPTEPRPAADALRRLLRGIELRGRVTLFARAAANALAALAPVAALVSLLAALFLPALAGRSESFGLAPAAVAAAVAMLLAALAGIVAARRPAVGSWTIAADAALDLEGRLDAGAAVLSGRVATRFAPLALADANARAAAVRARDAVARPRVARSAAIALVALALAFLASLLPPVTAASPPPPATDVATGHPPGANTPRTHPPSAPVSHPPDAQPLEEPPKPKPEKLEEPPPPEPKPEPQPQPQPQPEPQNEPDPLAPPPPAPDVKLDPKFLEPLVGEGMLREKDAFTPQPDEGTKPAKPLTPEELKRVFPELRKRAEASLPRQPFDEVEKRIVKSYLEWMPR